jgi:hypothetical protein
VNRLRRAADRARADASDRHADRDSRGKQFSPGLPEEGTKTTNKTLFAVPAAIRTLGRILGLTLGLILGVALGLVSAMASPADGLRSVGANDDASLVIKVHGCHRSCEWGIGRGRHRHIGPACAPIWCAPQAKRPFRC